MSERRGAVLCVIPARGGSKSIPRKNLALLGGRPLIAYSIETALTAASIDRTIVSTDDPEIAAVARACGAEVPFLRPAEIAGDLSTDLEVFEHALAWLLAAERYRPEICVHLRPTYPIRAVADVDRVVEVLRTIPGLDSVRSVAPARDTPFKMWFRDEGGLLTPVVATEIPDAYNLPRQQLPQAFLQNAAIDAVWARVITEGGSMSGRRVYGYAMTANLDIDTPADFRRAAEVILERGVEPTRDSTRRPPEDR